MHDTSRGGLGQPSRLGGFFGPSRFRAEADRHRTLPRNGDLPQRVPRRMPAGVTMRTTRPSKLLHAASLDSAAPTDGPGDGRGGVLAARLATVLALLVPLAGAVAGCSSDEGASPATTPASTPIEEDGGLPPLPELTAEEKGLVEARPYTLKVPSRIDPSTGTPLVLLLHGYTGTGARQDSYFRFSAKAEAANVLFAYADGTKNEENKTFWNASDACCNFYDSPVDDVKYLAAVIKDVSSKHRVDPARVYIVGHSNGGFMAYRLACDLSGTVAAVVSLAGAAYKDPTRCNPTEPVSVLQVHGTKDETIFYEGGRLGYEYPSAKETVALWASKNRCTGELKETAERKDVAADFEGNEAIVSRYDGCPKGVGVELWTMPDGVHNPVLAPTWADSVFEFLLAHPKVKP